MLTYLSDFDSIQSRTSTSGLPGRWDTYAWKVDSGPRWLTFIHLTDIYDVLILSQAP